MERVTGIGGLFFRARDPEALSQWYQEMPEQTEYLGAGKQQWMVNFRVRNLDMMVAQLRAAGVEVTVDPEQYPNGRFARLRDPEGNPIELWEPGTSSA